MEPEYAGDDIIVFTNAAVGCRHRPDRYVGDVASESAVSSLLQETMCMALDSAASGDATRIRVTRGIDHSLAVHDNGEPYAPTRFVGDKPVYELLFTELFACRQLKNNGEEVCGDGIVVACALSKWLKVDISWGGKHWHQAFTKGEPDSPIREVADTDSDWRQISFLPDSEIFPSIELNIDVFNGWIADKPCDLGSCEIVFDDKLSGSESTLHAAS